MFLLIYVLDSVSFVMFVCLSLYSLLPDLWWMKLFKELLKRRSVTSDMRRFRKTLDYVLIRDRVKFKVECLVRQSLFGQAPLYLADDCCLVSDRTRSSLWSADVPTCIWRREHSAVTATEHLQPLDLPCGTLFRSSCAIPTSPTDCSDESWRDTFFGKHEHGTL